MTEGIGKWSCTAFADLLEQLHILNRLVEYDDDVRGHFLPVWGEEGSGVPRRGGFAHAREVNCVLSHKFRL